jgi:transcription elongation factor Elf1
MKKQTHSIGENVEKICSACDEQLGHIVVSLTKTGMISKVSCSKCGLLGAYKSNSNLSKIQNLSTKTGETYSQSRTYRTGQIMSHPTFGTGEVVTVFDTKTIDVLFLDRVRRLIHSRV